MTVDRLFDLAGAIVMVTLVMVLVTNAKGAAQLVNAVGGTFAGALKVASGR